MKKTLAAVLAAMMALSTATVALAADTQKVVNLTPDLDGAYADKEADPDSSSAVMGDTTRYIVEVPDGGFTTKSDNTAGFTTEQLAWLIDNGYIKATAVVSSGRSNLAGAPVVKDVDDEAQLQFKVAHTYGTSEVKTGMTVKLTAAKNIYWDADTKDTETFGFTTKEDGSEIFVLKKGDTLVGTEVVYKASYAEITQYGEDMTITTQEVKDNNVKVVAEKLIEELDGEKATFYFGPNGDYAAFSANISTSQRDVNLYYSLDEIEDIADAYEDVDFRFIDFKGAPKFSKSGELTFDALNGEDTVVYEYVDGALVELDGEYDSTYNVITVDGVKKLGTYAVASEALELEVEAEPEVEEPAVEEENPNTGAC